MAKQPRTAINPTREQDFPAWYQGVIKAADMAENSPVRGCMTIKPYGFGIWENIQKAFDARIKALGVENAYFPLLIPLEYFSREAQHVDGFATECAVVTHHRLEKNGDGLVPASPLDEPLVIRPTSEMIIGDAMSRWISSYRDLPMKLNQWSNVMRWEMRPRMFLRTSEFLWQEGHNAFASSDDAKKDARKMLDEYANFAREYLAMPSICGVKTEDEKFPGAVDTYTFETIMQDGKALQSGTSHYMGQNFARSCGIKYQSKDGADEFAYTTSWGMSSRLIGGLIMMHGDDDGLIVPPKIAPQQVVIIPIMKDHNAQLLEHCRSIAKRLVDCGVRASVDAKDARNSDKMWGAIKRGVPLRVEIGGREMEAGDVTHTRRDLGRESKESCPTDEFIAKAQDILDSIQESLLARAEKHLANNTHDIDGLSDIDEFFTNGAGFVRAPLAVLGDWEAIKKRHCLTTRCLPFADDGKKVIIARAY